jgi:transcriptional regulator with XRE-family HTH domain
MDQKNVTKLARLVKENRVLKNYTQQELADMTGISLRSIQRIENAEVSPRLYTLNVLKGCLDFTVEPEQQVIDISAKGSLNSQQKNILSIGIAVLLFLLACAFVFQSPTFPENAFELSLYVAAIVGFYTIVMFKIWK